MPSSPSLSAPEESQQNGSAETSPLLRSTPRTDRVDEHSVEQGGNVEQLGSDTTTWAHEARIIAQWSAPSIVTYLLQRSITVASVFAVGRIGPTELGAVSLASITTSILGNSLIQGLATSLETLAGQAYGSGQKHLVGLHAQRTMYLILPFVIPLMVLWWKADAILVHILPEPRLAELTGLYLKIMLTRIPAFMFFECGKRFIQAQGIFYAPSYIVSFAAPLNVFMMWLFVWHFHWGFVGAPIAIAITENLMAMMLFLYIWLIDGYQCWGGFTKKAFTNWAPMVRLAVPGMLMNMAEFAVEEILTLASAQFGTSQLAAQSALVTLVTLTYNLSMPVSVAASTRVANWIGAKSADAAKTSAKVTIVFGLIISAFVFVILMSLQHQIPRLFTQDAEVIDILVSLFPLATVMQVFDGMAAISHGLLRGIARQELAGYLNLAVYYLIALPISLGTAFSLHWELFGVWTGITVGLFLVSTFEFLWLWFSNWDDAVEKAARRNESE